MTHGRGFLVLTCACRFQTIVRALQGDIPRMSRSGSGAKSLSTLSQEKVQKNRKASSKSSLCQTSRPPEIVSVDLPASKVTKQSRTYTSKVANVEQQTSTSVHTAEELVKPPTQELSAHLHPTFIARKLPKISGKLPHGKDKVTTSADQTKTVGHSQKSGRMQHASAQKTSAVSSELKFKTARPINRAPPGAIKVHKVAKVAFPQGEKDVSSASQGKTTEFSSHLVAADTSAAGSSVEDSSVKRSNLSVLKTVECSQEKEETVTNRSANSGATISQERKRNTARKSNTRSSSSTADGKPKKSAGSVKLSRTNATENIQTVETRMTLGLKAAEMKTSASTSALHLTEEISRDTENQLSKVVSDTEVEAKRSGKRTIDVTNASADEAPFDTAVSAQDSVLTNQQEVQDVEMADEAPVESDVHTTDAVESDVHTTDAVESGVHTTDAVESDVHTTDAVESGVHTTDAVESDVHTTDAVESGVHTTDAVESDVHTTDAVESGVHTTDAVDVEVTETARSTTVSTEEESDSTYNLTDLFDEEKQRSTWKDETQQLSRHKKKKKKAKWWERKRKRGKASEAEEEEGETEQKVKKKKKEAKPRPNYFVAVRVSDEEIHRGLKDVQQAVLEQEPNLQHAMIPLINMHITLLVTHLKDEQVDRAKEALRLAKARLNPTFLHPENRLVLTFQGLGTFRNDVVFAKIEESGHLTSLQVLAETVQTCFEEKEVYSKDGKGFEPHLTLMKMSRNFGKLRSKGIKKIDPKLYEEFKGHRFGEQVVEGLQLCSMLKKKEADGYYHTEEQVMFGLGIEHIVANNTANRAFREAVLQLGCKLLEQQAKSNPEAALQTLSDHISRSVIQEALTELEIEENFRSTEEKEFSTDTLKAKVSKLSEALVMKAIQEASCNGNCVENYTSNKENEKNVENVVDLSENVEADKAGLTVEDSQNVHPPLSGEKIKGHMPPAVSQHTVVNVGDRDGNSHQLSESQLGNLSEKLVKDIVETAMSKMQKAESDSAESKK